MFEFSVNSMVRGYDVYQEVWEVRIGEVLPCVRGLATTTISMRLLLRRTNLLLDIFLARFSVYVLYLFGEEAKYIAL